MKKVKLIVLMFSLLLVLTVSAAALTAEEIIDRVDDNQFIESAYMEARMIIEGRRTTEKEMYSYSRESDAFIEFTNPRDRGTKYLKLGDNLWMFFPDAEEEVPISGHMLRQGMAGSDFSYQDMMESEKLTELYHFELIGEEEYEFELPGEGGSEIRSVYVLRGQVKEGKEASYYERKVWVDADRFITLREELYARGGRLLKVMEVKEVQQFADERWYPMEMVMEDKLIEDSRTILAIDELEFDVEIPEGVFSLEALQEQF